MIVGDTEANPRPSTDQTRLPLPVRKFSKILQKIKTFLASLIPNIRYINPMLLHSPLLSSMSTIPGLPNSLNLSPHLTVHKYLFVCALTVAAWDTLVLSRRTMKLMRTGDWTILKTISFFMRAFMPVEFAIVGQFIRLRS
jgi:hypothetical protein